MTNDRSSNLSKIEQGQRAVLVGGNRQEGFLGGESNVKRGPGQGQGFDTLAAFCIPQL